MCVMYHRITFTKGNIAYFQLKILEFPDPIDLTKYLVEKAKIFYFPK